MSYDNDELASIRKAVWIAARAQLMAWWLDHLSWVGEPSDELMAQARKQANRILDAAE